MYGNLNLVCSIRDSTAVFLIVIFCYTELLRSPLVKFDGQEDSAVANRMLFPPWWNNLSLPVVLRQWRRSPFMTLKSSDSVTELILLYWRNQSNWVHAALTFLSRWCGWRWLSRGWKGASTISKRWHRLLFLGFLSSYQLRDVVDSWRHSWGVVRLTSTHFCYYFFFNSFMWLLISPQWKCQERVRPWTDCHKVVFRSTLVPSSAMSLFLTRTSETIGSLIIDVVGEVRETTDPGARTLWSPWRSCFNFLMNGGWNKRRILSSGHWIYDWQPSSLPLLVNFFCL